MAVGVSCSWHNMADGEDIETAFGEVERFLFRLSISDQRERFVLKGAMLFAIWHDDPFRPTRDLDLLGHGDPVPATVAESIHSICLYLAVCASTPVSVPSALASIAPTAWTSR